MPSTTVPTSLFSTDDLARACALVAARTGLAFGDRRLHVLEEGCLDGARHHGYLGEMQSHDTITQYLDALETAETNSPIWDRLIQFLTIPETYFFRDTEQMQALRTTILPALIAAHQADRALRIWSAGCSTGEEAYTLAILLDQLLPDIERWKITLLATDLNKRALHHAHVARYRPWSFRQTELSLRRTYFAPFARGTSDAQEASIAQGASGAQEGDLYDLNPAIRRMVTFAYLNLAEDSYPSTTNFTTDLDLILCRNVIIYLPIDVTQRVINRFQRCLAPGGWLIVGASEYHPDIYAQFQLMRIGKAMVYFRGQGAGEKKSGGEGEMGRGERGEAAPVPVMEPEVRPTLVGAQPITLIPECVDCASCSYKMTTARSATDTGAGDARSGPPSPEVCLQHNPRCVYACCGLAKRAADSGRLQEARLFAQQAIELDPLHAESHYLLGLVHDELGELTEAVDSLRKALYLDPSFTLAHYTISALYQRTGRHAEAARHRAIALRHFGA